jgi:hypothetical protein
MGITNFSSAVSGDSEHWLFNNWIYLRSADDFAIGTPAINR